MHAQVLGVSVDSVPCLKAWAESLGGIEYPLLSDFYPHGEAAQTFDVFRPEGHSERAIFVIDKQGFVRYVDVHDIDNQPDNNEIFRILARLEPELAQKVAHGEYARRSTEVPEFKPPEEDEVVMYCTPWCPDCHKARDYFMDHGVAYREVNIARDLQSARQVREWTGGKEVTPTFFIRGQVVIDFDRAKLDNALGIETAG